MELKNPEYLAEIARQQSVTRAAEKLFVTQSTLSQYLLKMEAELGTPLFLRDKSRLIPTDAGCICIQAARDILRIQNAAGDSVAALKNEGHIDLGVTSAWGTELLADILPVFKKNFPNVTLRLEENRYYLQMKALLRAGKIDMAVMAVAPDDDVPPQGYTHLRHEEIVLVLAEDHPFCAAHAGEETITVQALKALQGEDFLYSGKDSSIRRMEEQLFDQLMIRPNPVCELNNNIAALKMTAGGIGAMLSPLSYVHQAKGVRSFRFSPPLLRENALVFRRDVKKTEAMAFMEELIVTNSRFQEEPRPVYQKRK
ncbi:LysR family transcriptional regulator [Oscillibacter sp.]|uniref:LysR family transcriptional regulator n=1 Tax=Oscillibacter sp. TaxID=1945593 RepID=UPI0026198B77|nr:LysR family transcriptional regulator [Oscillibacter sp.]MDD3346095.1 LysR family transcriptional regulator [Oscillibacter sp.]